MTRLDFVEIDGFFVNPSKVMYICPVSDDEDEIVPDVALIVFDNETWMRVPKPPAKVAALLS